MRSGARQMVGRACRVTAGAVVAAWLANPVHAQQISEPVDLEALKRDIEEQTARLNALQRSLEDQERKLSTDRRELLEQRRQLEVLQGRITGRGTAPGSVGGAAPTPEAIQSAQAQQPKPVGEAPTSEAEARKVDVAQIFESPGVLTPRGKFVFEPSLQYLHSTDNRVALVGFTIIPAITIGLIDIRRVSRDTFVGALTGRYGFTNRFEMEAKLPYVSASSESITRPLATPSVTDSVFDADGNGIGDIEVAARYQLNEGGVDKPFYIGSLRVKSDTGKSPFEVEVDPITLLQKELPTGTGFWAVQPGITALFPSDPVVFFGGMSYLYSFEREVGNGFGKVSPGNVFDFNFGLGLALNDRSSFSIGYQHSVVSKAKQSGNDTEKTLNTESTLQLGTLRFGVAYRLTPRTNFNLSVGVGVTDDTPDLELTLRVPMTF